MGLERVLGRDLMGILKQVHEHCEMTSPQMTAVYVICKNERNTKAVRGRRILISGLRTRIAQIIIWITRMRVDGTRITRKRWMRVGMLTAMGEEWQAVGVSSYVGGMSGVGMHAAEEVVDAEIGEENGEEGYEHEEVIGAWLPEGGDALCMERHGIYHEGDERPCLFGVPAPIGAPADVCP